MLGRRFTVVVISVQSLLPCHLAAQRADPLEGLDAYVTEGMKTWKVPGLAVAIVRGDSVILAPGYDVRTIGRTDPVDANTLFAIGSLTKAFTGMLAGMLVDEGKLTWDSPLNLVLPQLALRDPALTRDLTLRDALTHRPGLARADAVWYVNPVLPRDSLVARLRFLSQDRPFRSGFL